MSHATATFAGLALGCLGIGLFATVAALKAALRAREGIMVVPIAVFGALTVWMVVLIARGVL